MKVNIFDLENSVVMQPFYLSSKICCFFTSSKYSYFLFQLYIIKQLLGASDKDIKCQDLVKLSKQIYKVRKNISYFLIALHFLNLLTYSCLFFPPNQYYFVESVERLLSEFPENAKNEQGKYIWKGYYRCPAALDLDLEDEYSLSFIVECSKLLARIFKLTFKED